MTGSQKMGEVSLAQETSEDPMSPSHFPVQPTETPSRLREGHPSPPPSSGWWSPGLRSQDPAHPSLPEEGGLPSPYSHTLSPKEEPEEHL